MGGTHILYNIIITLSLRPLVIGGAPQTKHLINRFLGPTSPVRSHRDLARQETAMKHRRLEGVSGALRKQESSGLGPCRESGQPRESSTRRGSEAIQLAANELERIHLLASSTESFRTIIHQNQLSHEVSTG